MLTLNDGRKEMYQWDIGRIATIDVECDVVHFSNLKYGASLAVEVKNGEVAIPNKLLTSGEHIYCWAFVEDENGKYTKQEQTLNVNKRAKPSDYVYTETETLTWKSLNERITKLESGTPSTMTGATAETDGASGLVPAPKAGEQNKFLRGDGTWAESDKTLTKSGYPADAMITGNFFKDIFGEIDFLNPLEIKSFSVSPNLVEKGGTVTSQNFSFSVNRMSAETTIEGDPVSGGSASRSDVLTDDKAYTLTATLKDVTKIKTATIRFVPPIYYGVGKSYTLENDTVINLNRVLTTSKSITFSVNAAAGEYILFALPVSLGTPSFNVGGFEGGFTLVGSFDFTNSSNHTERYRLYRSVNAGLGSTKVTVS